MRPELFYIIGSFFFILGSIASLLQKVPEKQPTPQPSVIQVLPQPKQGQGIVRSCARCGAFGYCYEASPTLCTFCDDLLDAHALQKAMKTS